MTKFTTARLADLHNHILPGVDDGARGLEESLRHLRAFAADGVTDLAVSPHLSGWLAREPGAVRLRLARLRTVFRRLRSVCCGLSDVPVLRFSQEVLLPDPDLARAVLRERGVGVEGTGYVLIEFGFDLSGDPRRVIDVVQSAGRKPIVAHPERYRRDGRAVGIEEIRGWKEAGALLQVNGGSVLGGYREPAIQPLAWQLLEEGLADLIGSDSHADHRPVSPGDVGRYMAARGAGEQARLLLSENPRHVLDDRPTESVRPWKSEAAA